MQGTQLLFRMGTGPEGCWARTAREGSHQASGGHKNAVFVSCPPVPRGDREHFPVTRGWTLPILIPSSPWGGGQLRQCGTEG